MKNFDEWNEQKKWIETRDMSRVYFNEREIWRCILGLNVGSEVDGKQLNNGGWYMRPVLIYKKFNGKMVFIIPITSEIKQDQYHFRFKLKDKCNYVILSQARLISTQRLLKKIGKMTPDDFEMCKSNILNMLGNETSPTTGAGLVTTSSPTEVEKH